MCYNNYMKLVYRRYKHILNPTRDQVVLLKQNLGCARFVYNHCIEYSDSTYVKTKTYPRYYGDSGFVAELTKLKDNPEYSWLKDADSRALQNAAKHVHSAFQNFFAKRARHPKYKAKHDHRQSYTTTNNIPSKIKQDETLSRDEINSAGTIRFEDGKYLRLPKIGRVRIRGKIRPYKRILDTAITMLPTGEWVASVLVEIDLDETADKDKHKLEHGDKITSIDLGIKRYATAFDGLVYEYIENPKYYERQLEKLRREHRKLCRMRNRESKAMKACGIHSRNYEKQRRKVARIYENITNMRMDTLHKLSRRLACENQTLIVETLEVKRMLEENDLAGLNRLIADASWGTFIRMLEYKSEETGCILYKVEKDYPSTQMCSNCGYINRNITLAMRRITCPECRETYDRDENAARNLYKRWLNAGNSSA